MRAGHPPGEQRVEIVGGGGVGAERRGGDVGRCRGPVLAPVVGAVRAQAGRDGLPVHHGAWRGVSRENPKSDEPRIVGNGRRGEVRSSSLFPFFSLSPFFRALAMTSAELLLMTLVM